MKRIIPTFAGLFLLLAAGAFHPAKAEGDMHAPTQESAENAFYASVVVPALRKVELAMPPAPQGWIVESKTVIAPSRPDLASREPGSLRYDYAITYKRVDGVSDEQKRLDDAAATAQKEATDATKVRYDDLMRKKTQAHQALSKAQKDKAAGKEKTLKRELEEIEGSLNSLSGETERKILLATEPLLVKDASLTVHLFLDEDTIAFPEARAITRPKVAFALRREGMRVGATGWKEPEILFLYGDWQEGQTNLFRARMDKKPFGTKPQTIMLSITGDEKRTTQFLKQMGLKDIVGLMK